MTSQRWSEVKAIFASALERAPGERAAFLDSACAEDQALRVEVESLLESHEKAGEFIESSPMSTDTFLAEAAEEDDPDIGRRIGAYRTVKLIGRGGMGSVYLAVRADDEFDRRVAIKLVRRGMEMDFIVRRFRNERQILANLDHPYIARLLDGGTTEDGVPYFIMEYVEGRPIHRYCEDLKLPVAERLQLFEKVCEAVQYAHDHQVIHRDLKPGNILVTGEGVPKLLDFGIAKLLDPEVNVRETEPTTAGFRMMTPAYASPEQLHGEPATAASDVYSLGVLLFELITGRRPERPRTRVEQARWRATQLTGELADIVAKATDEAPFERYASVELLAGDVRRHLERHGESAEPYAAGGIRFSPETKQLTGPKSIGILPFQSLPIEDKSDEYLGIGMADALITKLSNIRRILVRPTSSVLKYAQGTCGAVTAARELEVDYVLEGRIRRAGERVRVTVQLLKGEDGSPLWAGKFDEKFTDILNLEDSLSEQVARALIEKLTQEERDLLRKRGTDNPQAYQAYLRGRYYGSSFTDEARAKSLMSFSEALALDPKFAHAQAGIADYYIFLGIWGVMPPSECFASAKDAAMKALQLDPKLGEAQASFAFAAWCSDRDWESAARGFERAIKLNPDYPAAHQWHAYVASTRGCHEEAIARIERAQKIDPLSPALATAAAFVYYNARKPDRGLEELERAIRIDPRQYIVQQGFGWLFVQKKMYAEAIAAAEKALSLSPRNPVLLWTMASTLAGAGRQSEARQVLAQMVELSGDRYVSPYYMAVVHAELGDRDEAIECLRKAEENGDWWVMWMAVEPRLDSLRDDRRFKRLEIKVGLSGDDEECGCAPIEDAVEMPAESPVLSAPPARRRVPVWVAVVAILLGAVAADTIVERLISRKDLPFENIRVVKLAANGNARSAAISPDGKYLAYTLDDGGPETVWVRQAAVAPGVRVVPPAGALYRGLTFSRDGAHLYYNQCDANDFDHATLYRVPILGGAPQKLIADLMSPIALSPDGTQGAFIRVNQADGTDTLIVARLDGGSERKLATRTHPDRFGYSSAPAWSPDGKLLAAAIEKSDAAGHYVNLVTVRVSDGDQKTFSSRRWLYVERIAWVGSGLLIVGQDTDSTFQQVWVVPARGEARKINNDLNDYIGVSLTADARQLATLQIQVLANIWVAPKGNAERAAQITPGAGRFYDLAWTPDGKIISSLDASEAVDLWERNADGSGAKQLTSNGRRNYAPAASADGKYVVFHTNRTGNWNVWRTDADGGNPQALTHDNTDGSNWPQVTPDSKWIIYHHRAPIGAAMHLWKISMSGGDPVEVTGSGSCNRPSVSPTTGMLACWYSEDTAKPHWRIAIFRPEGGTPVKTLEFPPSVSVDSSFHWTPDGRAITYLDNRGGASNLWNQPVDGSPAVALTNFKAAQILSFAWSSDGELAYSRGIMTSDLVLISDVK